MSDPNVTDAPAQTDTDFTPWSHIHHSILDRVVNLLPISEDERRGLRMQLADAREQLENPEQSQANREARAKEAKDKRKAELQAELDSLK